MKNWYAVIGDPIQQSMSPMMHDQWFQEEHLEKTYIPIHVTPENLQQAVMSMKLLGCKGWNVTVPHKTAIIPFLDEIAPSAKVMNAVNTVVRNEAGKLVGYNTDGEGFVRSLEEVYGTRCKGEKVLVIGAGGAARGIAHALHSEHYGPITFTNRTLERAEQLASEIVGASAISITEAEQSFDTFGLIVQTTSVGMNFAQEGMPLNPGQIKKNAVVADIIYNPLETMFLQAAKANGASILNGTGMFVHQGALAFEKWTNTPPNTKKMIEHITQLLGGSYVNR